jgi:hypothetical protein
MVFGFQFSVFGKKNLYNFCIINEANHKSKQLTE